MKSAIFRGGWPPLAFGTAGRATGLVGKSTPGSGRELPPLGRITDAHTAARDRSRVAATSSWPAVRMIGRAPRTALRRSGGPGETAPDAVDQPLVREETGLVGEVPAVADIQAQVEIAEPPGAARLELLEDAVRARDSPWGTWARTHSTPRTRLRARGRPRQPPRDPVCIDTPARSCRSTCPPGTPDTRRRPRLAFHPGLRASAAICAARRAGRAPRRQPPGRCVC